MAVKSISLDVNNTRIHALHSGAGPVIMLLHASPMDSSSLVPLIEQLSKSYTVIAIDTPGYGSSDTPREKPSDLKPYADIIEQIRTHLQITNMALYGTATGGQIAVRYALEYPDHVGHLFLDNVAHFSQEMADEVIDDYFPDLSPRLDGTHLPLIWDNTVHLFRYFPWCKKEPAFQLSTPDPSLEVLHRIATLYLQAGKNYDWAYRAAFKHERREYIKKLQVPTIIFRWDHSVVKNYTDKIFEVDLPEHISGHRIKGDEDRYPAIAQIIKNNYASSSHDQLPLDSLLDDQPDVKLDHSNVASDDGPSYITNITPEKTGAYLGEAWQQCRTRFPEKSLEDINLLFINWARSI